MLNISLAERGAAAKAFWGVDLSWWLGYIRQYLVTAGVVLPAVQHLTALEFSLDVPAPLVTCTVSRFSPCYLLNYLPFSDGKHFESAKYCYFLASLTEIQVLFQKT